MLGHMKNFLDNLQVAIENKGEELVIRVKGDEKKVALVERKLKALKELCCVGDECCAE